MPPELLWISTTPTTDIFALSSPPSAIYIFTKPLTHKPHTQICISFNGIQYVIALKGRPRSLRCSDRRENLDQRHRHCHAHRQGWTRLSWLRKVRRIDVHPRGRYLHLQVLPLQSLTESKVNRSPFLGWLWATRLIVFLYRYLTPLSLFIFIRLFICQTHNKIKQTEVWEEIVVNYKYPQPTVQMILYAHFSYHSLLPTLSILLYYFLPFLHSSFFSASHHCVPSVSPYSQASRGER